MKLLRRRFTDGTFLMKNSKSYINAIEEENVRLRENTNSLENTVEHLDKKCKKLETKLAIYERVKGNGSPLDIDVSQLQHKAPSIFSNNGYITVTICSNCLAVSDYISNRSICRYQGHCEWCGYPSTPNKATAKLDTVTEHHHKMRRKWLFGEKRNVLVKKHITRWVFQWEQIT